MCGYRGDGRKRNLLDILFFKGWGGGGGIVTKTVIALDTSKYNNSVLGKGYQVFPAIHLLGLLDPIAVYKAMCAGILSVTTWEI